MTSKKILNILIGLIIPTVILITWVIISITSSVNEIIIPKPTEVLTVFVEFLQSGYLLNDLGWTLLRTLLGFFVGSSFGILIGIAMGTSRFFESTFSFSVDALRSIPATTLFPLFMLFFGLGLNSMIILVAFPCCWLVTINTMYGVKNSNHIRKDMAVVFRLNVVQQFWRVTLPDAAPSIVASLRLSIAMCLHMAIIGEMFIGSEFGIGRKLYDAHLLLKVHEMYAIIIISGLVGYLLNQIFLIFENKIVFWGGK